MRAAVLPARGTAQHDCARGARDSVLEAVVADGFELRAFISCGRRDCCARASVDGSHERAVSRWTCASRRRDARYRALAESDSISDRDASGCELACCANAEALCFARVHAAYASRQRRTPALGNRAAFGGDSVGHDADSGAGFSSREPCGAAEQYSRRDSHRADRAARFSDAPRDICVGALVSCCSRECLASLPHRFSQS